MKFGNLIFSGPLWRLTSYLNYQVKEAFFYYTMILTPEYISYFVHCCEQILDKQRIKAGRAYFAQSSRGVVYPDREHRVTEASRPVGLSQPHQESQREKKVGHGL